jgi:hypothetical protein
VPAGGANDRADGCEQVCTPIGAEASSHFAVNGGRSQVTLAGVVIGGGFGMVEERKQVLAQL